MNYDNYLALEADKHFHPQDYYDDVDEPIIPKAYVCVECKVQIDKDQIIIHPDFDPVKDPDNGTQYSCPDCYGEVKANN